MFLFIIIGVALTAIVFGGSVLFKQRCDEIIEDTKRNSNSWVFKD